MPPLLLVVDDTPALDVIVGRLARRAGHRVECLPTAEAAWRHLQKAASPQATPSLPDLVLLDLNLPGMSGADLCRRLRQTPALAELRVAVFGHWERTNDIARGLEAGADFVFSKELLADPAGWQRRVAEILESADGRPALRSLSCTPTDPPGAIQRLNQAVLPHWSRRLGAEVLRLVLCRALKRCPTATPPEHWLTPDGLALSPDFAREASPALLAALADALAEQAWRLLGTDARSLPPALETPTPP